MKLLCSIKNFYYRLSIRIKLTICVVLAAMIPVIIIAVMYSGRLYDMMIAETIRGQQVATDAIAPQVEASVASVMDCMDGIRSQGYYRKLFEEPLKEPPLALSESESAEAFADYIQTLVDRTPLSAVRFYLSLPAAEFDFFSSDASEDLFVPEAGANGTYWHGIFRSGNYTALHCPPLYLGPREAAVYGDCAYICRSYLNYKNSLYPCYIALYYPSDIYTDVLTDNLTQPDSVSYIINERDATVAATDASLAGIYRLNYSEIQHSLLSSNSFIEKDVLGNRVYAAFHYIPNANWLMVTVTPKGPLIETAHRTVAAFIAISASCILAAIGIGLTLTHSLTSRISSLIGQMTSVRTGTFVPMPEPQMKDEVGELIATYNYMIHTIDQLMRAQEKSAEELRISEYNALQAQINPHFLYNMMDVVNWMVLQGKAQEASSVIQILARFYKLTLSRKNSAATIGEELEHVNTYMQLQNMRYKDSFVFVADMPDELSNYQIPKLTLQPIIENSILHGILETESKTGTIVITGWQEENDICLLVSDDGIGMSDDVLSGILSEQNVHRTKGTNIAVCNIHNRLGLLYGEGYGLHYESSPGKGCEVTIRIPMIRRAVIEKE